MSISTPNLSNSHLTFLTHFFQMCVRWGPSYRHRTGRTPRHALPTGKLLRNIQQGYPPLTEHFVMPIGIETLHIPSMPPHHPRPMTLRITAMHNMITPPPPSLAPSRKGWAVHGLEQQTSTPSPPLYGRTTTAIHYMSIPPPLLEKLVTHIEIEILHIPPAARAALAPSATLPYRWRCMCMLYRWE